MERLTGRRDGRTYIVGCPDFALPKIVGLIIQQTVDRLAAIEDILGDEYDLEELREMIQAKRDGRCVVLPAPLGSQVWQLKYPTRIDKNGEEWVICSIKEATVEPAPFGLTLSMVNQIGKIYWLSKEEAQAALRREQDV